MRNIKLLTFCLFLFACANQTAPTGGPKDEEAPRMILSIPSDQDINFQGSEIVLEFDEYVKLNNPKEQLIISPRIDQEYEFKIRKNRVFITFENALPDSTTFTFNFREAIRDITEGNPPENLKLSFSSGDYLDSLSISGLVTELLTETPAEDYSLLLYDLEDTSTVFEHPPLYFTKTNEDGSFRFDNLPLGAFQLYAVKDKNKNLYLDFKNESYGFLLDTIWLDSAISDVHIKTQQLNALPLEVRSDRQNGTIYEVKYNKYITSYSAIYPEDTSKTVYSAFSDEQQNTINIYNTISTADSTLVILTTTDSLYISYQDSVYIQFEETVREPADLEQTVITEKVFPTDGEFNGTITFNKPIQFINSDSIYLYLDSLNIIPIDTSNYLKFNTSRTEATIDYNIDLKLFDKPQAEKKEPIDLGQIEVQDSTKKIKKELKPHLYFGSGAFISVESDTSQTTKTDLKFDKIDKYGLMLVEVNTDWKSYLVQLLDQKYNVIQQVNSKEEFSFSKVKPGEYFIRVLVDSNLNSHWDTGNILNRQEHEPVYYYTNEDNNQVLTIRANWELGPIILSF